MNTKTVATLALLTLAMTAVAIAPTSNANAQPVAGTPVCLYYNGGTNPTDITVQIGAKVGASCTTVGVKPSTCGIAGIENGRPWVYNPVTGNCQQAPAGILPNMLCAKTYVDSQGRYVGRIGEDFAGDGCSESDYYVTQAFPSTDLVCLFSGSQGNDEVIGVFYDSDLDGTCQPFVDAGIYQTWYNGS